MCVRGRRNKGLIHIGPESSKVMIVDMIVSVNVDSEGYGDPLVWRYMTHCEPMMGTLPELF